jgi:hypothetical protein
MQFAASGLFCKSEQVDSDNADSNSNGSSVLFAMNRESDEKWFGVISRAQYFEGRT